MLDCRHASKPTYTARVPGCIVFFVAFSITNGVEPPAVASLTERRSGATPAVSNPGSMVAIRGRYRCTQNGASRDSQRRRVSCSAGSNLYRCPERAGTSDAFGYLEGDPTSVVYKRHRGRGDEVSVVRLTSPTAFRLGGRPTAVVPFSRRLVGCSTVADGAVRSQDRAAAPSLPPCRSAARTGLTPAHR